MTVFSFVISAAVSAALVYLGEKKHQEIEQINKHSKLVVDFCNDYIHRAQLCIQQRRDELDRVLNYIGELKNSVIAEVFPDFLAIFDSFENFDVVFEVDSMFDKYRGIATFEKLKESVRLIEKNNFPDTSEKAYYKKMLFMSIAAFGLTATTAKIVSATSVTLMPQLTLLGKIPLAASIGFSVTSLIENYQSKSNYNNAIEFFELTRKFAEEITELLKSFDMLLGYLSDMAKLLRNMSLEFAYSLLSVSDDIETQKEELVLTEIGKFNAAELPLSSKTKIKSLYILAQILYASFDLPLFTLDGSENLETSHEMYENVKKCTDLRAEIEYE
ncbi:MAG: hypothetical protein SPF87_03140 [Bacilli bacterium]|nr:hypothetical protein [Bacilli bacterium]